MPHRIIDKFACIVGGSFSGLLLNVNWISTLSDAGIKVVVTVIVGMCGGIAGLAGKDIYNNYLKKYIKK